MDYNLEIGLDLLDYEEGENAVRVVFDLENGCTVSLKDGLEDLDLDQVVTLIKILTSIVNSVDVPDKMEKTLQNLQIIQENAIS